VGANTERIIKEGIDHLRKVAPDGINPLGMPKKLRSLANIIEGMGRGLMTEKSLFELAGRLGGLAAAATVALETLENAVVIYVPAEDEDSPPMMVDGDGG